MIAVLLVTLIVLWFLGYVRIDGLTIPDITLFAINGNLITLWDMLILLVVSWAIGILPTPFREVAAFLLILWILAVLGIISLGSIALSNIIVLAIIVGLLASLFRPVRTP